MSAVHLPDDLVRRLEDDAAEHALSLEEWLLHLSEAAALGVPPGTPKARRLQASKRMMAQIEEESRGAPATDVDWSRDAAYPDDDE